MGQDLTGVDYLMAMPQYGLGSDVAIRPGLARIGALLEGMDHPEEGIPVIHVAGTNGKGSTASWIAAILTAQGLRVGLHTSPHLLRPGERMRVNGVAAPTAWLSTRLDHYRPLIESCGASYFEVTVAMSLLRFSEEQVDVAVMEVGLGGRLDATNILTPSVSVVTTVGLDHTHILGDTLAEIAAEKAGIIKVGAPVVLGRQAAEARKVLADRAVSQGGSLLEVQDASWSGWTLRTTRGRYTHLYPALAGEHQRDNAATAVMAAETFLVNSESGKPKAIHRTGSLKPKAVRAGLRHVRKLAGLRARFEIVRRDPLIVLDVAHNPEALALAVGEFGVLTAERKDGHRRLVLALMADKDVDATIGLLAGRGLVVHPLRLKSPRALPPEELVVRLAEAGVDTEPTLETASIQGLLTSLSPGDSVLATGSHQVVAEVIRTLEA